MRNLQKILALVLALVMSLSLMATASADFSDQADIDPTYAESVEVLNGLNVFKGYPTGDFQPKGTITRAEVAAIIYRIATGDVEDTQKDIYSQYQKFSDVTGHWAAGYINYCANAEYIKGRGDGKFYPDDKVTGYEALAMILRVVGYDKNGEFTGSDWHIQTAAIANQQKVTEKVQSGLLAEAATREMVAELLCKAILIPTVNYTLAYGYQQSTDPKATIAYKNFQMERLTGVVTGNEIADLEGTSPMAANRSRMLFADGTKKVVEFSTGLEDLGLSVRAYIVPVDSTYSKLVTGKTYPTEANNVYETEKNCSVSDNPGSAIKDEGINSLVGAEHYINYDQSNEWTARSTIRYFMDVQWTEREAYTMLRDNGGKLWTYTDNVAANGNDVTKKGATKEAKDAPLTKPAKEDAATWSNQHITNLDYTYHYEKTVYLDTKLSQNDWNNLYDIFIYANRLKENGDHVDGEVHTGTTQVNEDISDHVRWEDFTKTYLTGSDIKKKVEKNTLGNWLRIIDNDNDGVAEYVLQTIYTVGKIAANGKNLDNVGKNLADEDAKIRDNVNNTTTSMDIVPSTGHYLVPSEESLAAGEVVVYAVIDGNIRAQKAESTVSRIQTVNRADAKVTLADGTTVLDESAVHEHAEGLRSGVINLDGNTNYTLYKDFFGNLAAFTEGTNGGLVLVTNGWYNSTISGPEYAVQAYVDGENGRSLQTVNLSSEGSLFVDNRSGNNNSWNKLRTDFGTAGNFVSGPINSQSGIYTDNIHTIVANLDGNVLTPVDKVYNYSQQWRMLDMYDNAIPGRDNNVISWANAYATNYTAGNTPAYNAKITEATDVSTTNANKPAADYYEVRALADTVYYVVSRAIGSDPTTNRNNVVVQTYVGYNNMPKIDGAYIEDVYAVGTRHTASTVNSSASPVYYTANVVVIELKDNYNGHKVHAEQVFIPDFYQVTGSTSNAWNGIEEVTMIRGNGELQENVKVDLRHSVAFNAYDIVSGTATLSDWQPGLYFMDPSDSDPNVYVIEKMHPSDIRANDYMVGYVREDLATNNYAQIEIMARPAGVSAPIPTETYIPRKVLTSTNLTTATDYYPIDSGDLNDWQAQARYVAGTSKTYTYGGATSSLKAAEAYDVLSELRADQLEGVDRIALNERWFHRSENQFTNKDRNEVLVRYDAVSGQIIYAISFNKGADAQTAWWNSLPARTASTLTEEGNGLMNKVFDTRTGAGTELDPYVLTMPHWQVMDEMKKNGNLLLVDVNSLSNTVKSFTLQRRIAGVDNDWVTVGRTERELRQWANDLAAEERQVTYKLTIELNQGVTVVYNLVKNAAAKVADLSIKTGSPVDNTGATLDNGMIKFGANTEKLGIKAFINSFAIPTASSAKWTIHRYGDTTVEVSGKNNSDVTDTPADYVYIPAIGDNETMVNVDYVEVTITSEDTRTGEIVTKNYIGGTGSNGTQAQANIIKKQAEDLVANSGASGDTTVQSKLSDLKTHLNTAAAAGQAALDTYLAGQYKTDLAALEAAIAAAKTISLKLDSDSFAASSKPFTATATLPNGTLIGSAPTPLKDGNVTLTVTRASAAEAKSYIFTATASGAAPVKTEAIAFAKDEASKTINLTLGYGVWSLSAAEVKSDNVTVSFTNDGTNPVEHATVAVDGQSVNNGLLITTRDEGKKITVTPDSGYVVASVTAPSCLTANEDGTWTITIPSTYAMTSLVVTVTVVTEAENQSVENEANTINTVLTSSLSSAAQTPAMKAALAQLSNAKSAAQLTDAKAAVATAAGVAGGDVTVLDPADSTAGSWIDVSKAALSTGIVAISSSDGKTTNLYGTISNPITAANVTSEEKIALAWIWYGQTKTTAEIETLSADIMNTILNTVKEPGDSTALNKWGIDGESGKVKNPAYANVSQIGYVLATIDGDPAMILVFADSTGKICTNNLLNSSETGLHTDLTGLKF